MLSHVAIAGVQDFSDTPYVADEAELPWNSDFGISFCSGGTHSYATVAPISDDICSKSRWRWSRRADG